ncbi:unnamed protein product [Phaeothamnion confervicola]
MPRPSVVGPAVLVAIALALEASGFHHVVTPPSRALLARRSGGHPAAARRSFWTTTSQPSLSLEQRRAAVNEIAEAEVDTAAADADAPAADLRAALGAEFEGTRSVSAPAEGERKMDAQQARVIVYILLSLIPCLLLLPLMGSNELIPLDPSLMQQ